MKNQNYSNDLVEKLARALEAFCICHNLNADDYTLKDWNGYQVEMASDKTGEIISINEFTLEAEAL